MDIKKKYFGNDYNILINNGKEKTGVNLINFVSSLKELGAGEVVLNSIDRDGTMQGYDFGVIDDVRANTTLPLTILGGAGSLDHISELISRYGIIGAAAGSLFVFKGKYRAVLINYPDKKEKETYQKYAIRLID